MIPWTSSGGWYKDPNAFIFLIRSNMPSLTCPTLFPVKQNVAVSSVPKSGPLFGYDITIGLWDKRLAIVANAIRLQHLSTMILDILISLVEKLFSNKRLLCNEFKICYIQNLII